jgi:hypothetical protein
MMVTPDHKLVIKTQANQVSKGKIKFELAKDITPQITIPIACNGVNRKKYNNEYRKNWAAFIGIYVAEGSATGTCGGKIQMPGRGYSVYISQSKNSRHLGEIKNLLDKLEYKFRYNGKAFVCSNKKLWEYLYRLGNSSQKYIPREIFNYGTEALKEMWKFMLMGDGWVRNKSGVGTYCTVSKRLFDDTQELLTLLGIPSGVTVRNLDNHKADGKIIKKQPKNGFKTQYWISAKDNKFAGICQSGQNKQKQKYEWIDYSGEVFCVSVPNGTVIVRRNNRVAISGNCDLVRYYLMSNPKYFTGYKDFNPESERVY